MKFSRTVAYAVQAALTLADVGTDEPVPCSRLAAIGKMPERFLLQILRMLVNHGVLLSTRGVEGGYRLSRPASEISLLDVIEAIDGPIKATLEINRDGAGRYQARLEAAMNRIAGLLQRELGDVSLAELLGSR